MRHHIPNPALHIGCDGCPPVLNVREKALDSRITALNRDGMTHGFQFCNKLRRGNLVHMRVTPLNGDRNDSQCARLAGKWRVEPN